MDDLTAEHWLGLARLWAQLASAPASDLDGPMNRVFGELARSIGAAQGHVIFARRVDVPDPDADPLRGWRPVHVLPYGDALAQLMAASREWSEDGANHLTDPFTQRVSEQAGRVRCYRRGDLVADDEWNGSPGARLLGQLGVVDMLVGSRPVQSDLELHLSFHRLEGAFSIQHRSLVWAALEGLAAHCQHFVRSLGFLDGNRKLSPRERDALSGLLAGLSEKAIAAQMGITPRTAHQYVVAIYRAFGVNTRAELMSLWLGPIYSPPLAPTD